MNRTATISRCERYRYLLGREWGGGPRALFVMLNPSTADSDVDDPTIRRCIGFAKREGCGSLSVVNLFPLRATNPTVLACSEDKLGPPGMNRGALEGAMEHCDGPWVAAWGAHKLAIARALQLPIRFYDRAVCLGKTKTGAPRHPLYVPRTAPLVPLRAQPAEGGEEKA